MKPHIHHTFTERELDILACMINGRTSKKIIAETLQISPKTVSSHMHHIFQKTNCSSWEYVLKFLEKNEMKTLLDERFLEKQTHNKKHTIKIPKAPSHKNKQLLQSSFFMFCGFITFISFFYILLKNETNYSQGMKNIQQNFDYGSTFLQRENILEVIDQKLLTENNHIPIISLIGMGGAGKTTLSKIWQQRYLAHHQDAFSWVVNAETKESLKASFSNLSLALAQTPEEKSILNAIENTTENKGQKRLFFIINLLKKKKNWLLIFDNVEKLTDIENALPTDKSLWGNGKVIITTRNSFFQSIDNLYNYHYINLSSLSETEQYMLFTKIRYKNKPFKINGEEEEEIKAFLKSIPPFPLDIAIAARYINYHKVSYKQYLQQLKEQEVDFNEIQKDLIQESSAYSKTRYRILSLSFQHTLQKNPQFEELLMFLTTVDSQNIPRALFEKHFSQITCLSFLNELKKHSLIYNDKNIQDTPVFSVHRTTQNLAKVYLARQQKNNTTHMYAAIGNTYAAYLNDLLDIEQYHQIHLIVPHTLRVLENNDIPGSIKGIISISLGWTYFCLGEDIKAQAFLENGINILKINSKNKIKKKKEFLSHTNKQAYSEDIHIVRATTYLGIIALRNGQLSNAKKLLEWCLPVYQLTDDYVGHSRVLTFLAHLYMLLDNYEPSEKMFLESISLCNKHNVRSANKARAFAFLGLLYKEKGLFDLSLQSFEQSHHAYEQEVLKAWSLAHKAGSYIEIGQYDSAISILQKVIKVYEKKQASHHIVLGWVHCYLGSAYRKKGLFSLAEEHFHKGLTIYKNHANKDMINIGYPFPLVLLGKSYTHMEKYDEAEKYLESAYQEHIRIFGLNNNRTQWCNKARAELFLLKNELKKATKAANESFSYYEKILPPSHPKRAKLLSLRGEILFKTQAYNEAEKILKETLSYLEKNYGNNHYECTPTKRRLAKLYIEKSNLDTAIKLLDSNIDVLQKIKHPDINIDISLKKSIAHLKRGDMKQ